MDKNKCARVKNIMTVFGNFTVGCNYLTEIKTKMRFSLNVY